jgi:heavy metal sensor kinase
MARRVPVRWRLTLWYTLVLTALVAILSLVFYYAQQRLLLDSLDDTLSAQAALTTSSIAIDGTDLRATFDDFDNPKDGEQFVRVANTDGDIIAATGGSTSAPSDFLGGIGTALGGQSSYQWMRVDTEHMRVFSQPIRASDGHVVGVVQVGLSDGDIKETLNISVTLALLLLPVTLLIAGGSGYWLAGRALKPINTIAELARNIESDALSRRIELELPNDEIGTLANMFNRMLDRIERAFVRQRQFTADASHELRTPLTLMHSQLEVALASPRDAERDQEVFAELTQDVDRLTRLAAALLTLARSDNEQLLLTRELIDVDEFMRRIQGQYAERAAERGVKLVTDATPGTFVADEDKLTQVFFNLLDNALRYAPAGTSVLLAAESKTDGVEFKVTDEGKGISAEHLPHIFDRFYRVEPGRAEESSGIGLGLSICQMIIEAHEGTITATSAEGSGTTITISLPQRANNPSLHHK